MTEEEAKKIGGKQGVILMSTLIIIGIIWFFGYLLYELNDRGVTHYLTKLKQSNASKGFDYFTERLWTLFELFIYGVALILVGYFMGRRAGFSIIIKGRNYLGIGYWSMLKMIFAYAFIFAFISITFNYLKANNPTFHVIEYIEVFAPYFTFLIIIYALPLSLIGFWLGNKIDNERIKHLSTENQESNYTE